MGQKRFDLRSVAGFFNANRLIVLLLLINFLANFLFVFWFKFYSDDWSTLLSPDSPATPLTYSLMDSQRPLLGVIFYFEKLACGQNALAYHVVTLLVNSAMIALLFLIFKKIFAEFGCQGDAYPFIATALYAVLFNKDQLYAWAIMNDVPYLLFLLCIYLYLYRSRWYHIYLSLAMYLLGLFTYEAGIAIPGILFVYEVLRKKDFRAPLLFAVPLGINLLIRFTDWFGFGHNGIPRSIPDLPFSVRNDLAYRATEHFFKENIGNGIHGLQQMDTIWLAAVLLINVVLLYLACRQIKFDQIKPKNTLKLAILGVVIIAGFILPHYLQAYLDSRHFVFIDIGFALLITLVIGFLPKVEISKVAVFAVLGLCMVLCQGLFVNWVIAGNLLDDVDRYIASDAQEIDQYSFIYFNSTSFTLNKPNTVQLYDTSPGQRLSAGPWDNYYYYFNAKCMDTWSLETMLRRNFDIRNKTVSYAWLNPMISDSSGVFTYRDAMTGNNTNVSRADVYEISYESVYGPSAATG